MPCAPVLAVEIARLMLIPILLLPLLRSLLTFLTFLRMRHKGLFIIASDIIESHFVDLDRISGHFFYVFYDNLVIRMFLIVLVALGAHVTRQVIDGPRDYLGILPDAGSSVRHICRNACTRYVPTNRAYAGAPW